MPTDWQLTLLSGMVVRVHPRQQERKRMSDIVIKGGLVQQLDTHGGNVYMYGGLIEEANLGGGTITSRGGIIENTHDCRTMYAGQEVKERIVYVDKVKTEVQDTPETLARLKELEEQCKELMRENYVLAQQMKGLTHNELFKDNIAMAKAMKRAKNRERVLIAQRDEAIRQAMAVGNWDTYRPTRDEVSKVYKTMCAFSECDDDI